MRRSTRMWRALIASLLVAIGLVMMTGTASAATASYTSQNVGPTLYQTNYVYTGPNFTPLGNPPATGVISSVYTSWTYNASTAPAGTEVYLCAGAGNSQCLLINFSGSSTSVFNGFPANTVFHHAFLVRQSVTRTINPPVFGGRNYVGVTYTY